jgi:CheY-like chemotaxis protein
MRLPIMDGHEATRRIKATPQGRSTIIIALTASAFEEERELVLADGCDDYVRKPFRQDEIADKLARHLGAQFLYEGEASRQVEPGQLQGALDLAGLPAQELSDLKQAALEADAGKIMRLADQIREQNPALAQALADAVNRFDYAAILSAIQER